MEGPSYFTYIDILAYIHIPFHSFNPPYHP
jgi:hypothetical protein